MNRASNQPEPNPLREGLSPRAVPQPCIIVIFGATGDLTHRKLIPALYNLAADGDLPNRLEMEAILETCVPVAVELACLAPLGQLQWPLALAGELDDLHRDADGAEIVEVDGVRQ